jgi:hypothetical protein
MKQGLKLIISIILLFSGKADILAYTEVPVMLHLDISRQNDTFGFNLTAKLPAYLYQLIQDEQLTLWDSPKKNTRISRESLTAIERSSGTNMNKTHHLFLYELWSSSRRKTDFVILGFGFVNETKDGRISYGYVDAREAFPFLVQSLIDLNVNGPARLTYWQALTSRNYHYNLVQFGNKNFTDKPERSFQIRDKAFSPKKNIHGIYRIPATKDVQYSIDPDVNDPQDAGFVFMNRIQDYLNKNREVFFNIGGNRYYDYKTYLSELVVTRIEVNETWTRTSMGFIDFNIRSVTIFVNNKKLDPVSIDLIQSFGILYKFNTAEDLLKEKKFKYQLLRINNTYISEPDAEKYLKALAKYRWTQISNYVKFY